MMRRSRVLVTLTAVLSCASTGLLAQEGELDRAESLVREGRANEARVVLVSWWDERYDDAGRGDQQRALWLRARLTVGPDQAIRDYQRLVVLYPTGPYADRALFRLAGLNVHL